MLRLCCGLAAIVACAERFARRSAARRSEGPVFTHTGTARRDFLADGLEAFNAHVRASARARGAPFAEIDIFAEPAATLFDRVEALLPQAQQLRALPAHLVNPRSGRVESLLCSEAYALYAKRTRAQ